MSIRNHMSSVLRGDNPIARKAANERDPGKARVAVYRADLLYHLIFAQRENFVASRCHSDSMFPLRG